MRHRLKRVVIIGLAVILGVSLCVLISIRRSSSDLEAWKKMMRQRGEKFAFVEVAKPFAQAAVDWELSLSNVATRLVNGPHQLGDIQLMNTNKAGFAWPTWRQDNPTQKASTNFWAEYVNQMNSNETVLAEVRNLVASKPSGSVYDPARLFGNSGTHNYIARRAIAQNLAGATLCALHRAERQQALQHLHTLIDFSSATAGAGELLVDHTINVAIMGLALQLSWETCQDPSLEDAQLAELFRRWQHVNLFAEVAHVTEMERAHGLACYEFARTNQGGVMSPLFIGARPARPLADRLRVDFTERLWRTSWADNDEWLFLQFWQPVVEGARAVSTNDCYALFRARTRESCQLYDTVLAAGALSQARHVLALCAAPNFRTLFRHTWRHESFRRVTLTAIALKRYQLRHGQLPESLGKLVPEFMPDELSDPMSGKSLLFQPTATGIMLLYSVGENGVDDGGLGDDIYWPRLGSDERE